MVALRCSDSRMPLFLASSIWSAIELPQRLLAHEGRGEDLPLGGGQLVLEDGGLAVGHQFDPEVAAVVHDHRLLVAVEVAGGHVRDMGRGTRRPGAQRHGLRVLAGIFLDRERRPAVGVAFAQHRVDGAPQALGITLLDLLFLGVLRLFRIIGQLVALALQLRDRFFQLRDGGADVGQLDDVGFDFLGQFAQLRQEVGDALALGQILGEVGDDPAGQGDVPGLHFDPGPLGEGLDDRQQGVGRQCGGFVDFGPDDLVCAHCGVLSLGCNAGRLNEGKAHSPLSALIETGLPGQRRAGKQVSENAENAGLLMSQSDARCPLLLLKSGKGPRESVYSIQTAERVSRGICVT